MHGFYINSMSKTVRYTVGPKGQVVIPKALRDRLGVEPGWVVLPRPVDDHVEVYFLPPSHQQSLKGSLASHIRRPVGAGEEWAAAREAVWRDAAHERESAIRWES